MKVSMHRGLLVLALPVLALVPVAAHAQLRTSLSSTGFNPIDGNLGDHRVTGEFSALGMTLEAKGREEAKARCKKFGCLFILNINAGWNVVGFYLSTSTRASSKEPVWSPNQLPRTLEPGDHSIPYFKVGNETMCALPARVELHNPATEETMNIFTTVSLCPGDNVILRPSVYSPKVTLGE
ncbi:MAG: hypothetical protein V4480_04615 [Patescibacteria group bacterium]